MNVLYVNHAVAACGVYQIGRRIAGFLTPSTRYNFIYLEARSGQDVVEAIQAHQTPVVIYNYFPTTLPFVDESFTAMVRRHRIAQVGIIHDPMEAGFINYVETLFDRWIVHDETNPFASAKKFMTCRPISRFPAAPPPERLSFGSHGFAVSPWKAFDFIVEVINHEFNEAVINMNIGGAAFGDPNADMARQWAEACRHKVTKPGIELNITHNFLETEEDMIRFLQRNTVNVYFHGEPPNRGPAGSADLAIASRRALVVNQCYMYRHIWTQLGAYGKNGNLTALYRNEADVSRLYEAWSPERVRSDYERMLDTLFKA